MQISVPAHRKNPIGIFLSSLLLLAGVVFFYETIGQTIEPETYIGHLLAALVLLCLLQYAAGINFFSPAFLPHVLVGLSWCLTFPLLYFWSYYSSWFVSELRMDFLFGIGLILLLGSAEAGCAFYTKKLCRTAIVFAVLDLLCLLIPLAEDIYYFLFQHCLTPASLMALYLTNPRESLDFIESNFSLPAVLGIVLALATFLTAAYLCNRYFCRRLVSQTSPNSKRPQRLLALLLLLTFFYVPFALFPNTSILLSWKDVAAHVHETAKYSQYYAQRMQDLKLTGADTLAQKAPGTVIMVIGESASRNYMKAYTPSFAYEDTPWLEQCMQNPDFIVFRNSYSCWVQTVPVLERALTEESQYHDKDFISSTSILDVAKKAGYETYWFSNQGRYGQDDSAITLVAKTADHALWSDDAYELSSKFDEDLLKFLPAIDATKNNFIVLHIMGSHIYYNNRYPENFARWKTGDAESTEEAYANSTLYTDYVLSQIYQYAKQNLHLQAMIYYSDHGEDLHISHNPDAFRFDMVRIPMFVYLSPEYQRTLPVQSRVLHHNQEQFFTNDMIYDTVCGILNAPSNHYDAGQNFASPDYRFNRDTLTTMLGQKQLTEDPYLMKQNTAAEAN